jgi:glycosyltransferase involved in cell wall biosynthesis
LSVFPTYSDLAVFVAQPPEPLPSTPVVAWVGALQPVKDPRTFAEAWRQVAERVPEAEARIVGDGPMRDVMDELAAEFPERVQTFARLAPTEVARVLDESTVLALPSRSEGFGRVVVEAFVRGRGVVGSAVGGIADLVRDGENGLLVPSGDPAALAVALERVLGDPAVAARLSRGALVDGERLHLTVEEYADAVCDMVDRALTGS